MCIVTLGLRLIETQQQQRQRQQHKKTIEGCQVAPLTRVAATSCSLLSRGKKLITPRLLGPSRQPLARKRRQRRQRQHRQRRRLFLSLVSATRSIIKLPVEFVSLQLGGDRHHHQRHQLISLSLITQQRQQASERAS